MEFKVIIPFIRALFKSQIQTDLVTLPIQKVKTVWILCFFSLEVPNTLSVQNNELRFNQYRNFSTDKKGQ